MKNFQLLDYRWGIAGKIIAILVGLVALGFHFSEGAFSDTTVEKVYGTLSIIAITAMQIAVFSKEPREDERMNLVRMRAALGSLVGLGFLGYIHRLLVNLLSEGSFKGISVLAFSIIAMALYLISLEIHRRRFS